MRDGDQRTDFPEEFLEKMRGLMGEEYAAFLDSCRGRRMQGLRLNPLKVIRDGQRRKIIAELGLTRIPWARDGYYYGEDIRPGRHPWHEAGVFYIQEPSAMAAAELLGAEPGEKVLDLCAAPGGKATQIGGQLKGRGLLVCNEIHPARAKILSQNVERMGIRNAVVTNEAPEVLAGRFPLFFDKVLVDAPCSGEGMFRKDADARSQWSPENVVRCAGRQAHVLDQGAAMVRPGGRMVYSTCTFSPEENEGSIRFFLERTPDFYVERVSGQKGLDRGRPEWTPGGQEELARTFRIWPHRTQGEGHYLAVLRRREDTSFGGAGNVREASRVKDKQVKTMWREFAEDTLTEEGMKAFGGEAKERLVLFGEQLYFLPEGMPDYGGLRVLRPGLHLGTVKKKRFEPSHSLALCLDGEQVRRSRDFGAESSRMAAYLRGETFETEESGSGWSLITVDGFSVGWAKQVGAVLKNHYPKGLRRG